MTDFKNKKVLIMGLGLHGGGAGAAEFFAKAGAKAYECIKKYKVANIMHNTFLYDTLYIIHNTL